MGKQFYQIICATLVMMLSASFTAKAEGLSINALDSLRAAVADTTLHSRAEIDSIIISRLQIELQEMKLNEIMAREEYERKNKESIIADSIQKAERRRRIDSLRNILPGDPLVVEGDTLLKLYAQKGGLLPAQRVIDIAERIEHQGRKLTVKKDSIYILDTEYFAEIMSGSEVIMTITDNDALWQNTTRLELAEQYLPIISDAIDDLRAKYGLMEKVKGGLLTLLVVVIQVILILLTLRFSRYTKKRILAALKSKFKPVVVKGYEVLSPVRQARVLILLVRFMQYLLIFFQLLITIPILFSIFPETQDLSQRLFSYIFSPIKSYARSLINFLPDLIKIIILIIIFRYIVRGFKYLSNEIASSRLKLSWFYPDWAVPTFQIIRILLYSFLVIMIWPLIPYSKSDVFKGVSVFIGVIFSLGSTSIIGNLMAGLVITYMRSFTVGDQIKMNDVIGTVIEKTPFVTRIKSNKNEIITVPNSVIMSSQTINYSNSAKSYGVIIYTDVTVGYEVPWRKVQELLIASAESTPGIMKNPKPFMLTRTLADPYCVYQINAYTREDKALPRVYSALHQHIIDRFNEAGIELMSPIYYTLRDGNDLTLPPEYMHGGDAKTKPLSHEIWPSKHKPKQ